jgi:hypothetical protein
MEETEFFSPVVTAAVKMLMIRSWFGCEFEDERLPSLWNGAVDRSYRYNIIIIFDLFPHLFLQLFCFRHNLSASSVVAFIPTTQEKNLKLSPRARWHGIAYHTPPYYYVSKNKTSYYCTNNTIMPQ